MRDGNAVISVRDGGFVKIPVMHAGEPEKRDATGEGAGEKEGGRRRSQGLAGRIDAS